MGALEKMAMASSLVMIAKSGAENFITFGAENKLSEVRRWPKKQQDVSCFWPRSYPGCLLSPDSKDINYFIRR